MAGLYRNHERKARAAKAEIIGQHRALNPTLIAKHRLELDVEAGMSSLLIRLTGHYVSKRRNLSRVLTFRSIPPNSATKPSADKEPNRQA